MDFRLELLFAHRHAVILWRSQDDQKGPLGALAVEADNGPREEDRRIQAKLLRSKLWLWAGFSARLHSHLLLEPEPEFWRRHQERAVCVPGLDVEAELRQVVCRDFERGGVVLPEGLVELLHRQSLEEVGSVRRMDEMDVLDGPTRVGSGFEFEPAFAVEPGQKGSVRHLPVLMQVTVDRVFHRGFAALPRLFAVVVSTDFGTVCAEQPVVPIGYQAEAHVSGDRVTIGLHGVDREVLVLRPENQHDLSMLAPGKVDRVAVQREDAEGRRNPLGAVLLLIEEIRPAIVLERGQNISAGRVRDGQSNPRVHPVGDQAHGPAPGPASDADPCSIHFWLGLQVRNAPERIGHVLHHPSVAHIRAQIEPGLVVAVRRTVRVTGAHAINGQDCYAVRPGEGVSRVQASRSQDHGR